MSSPVLVTGGTGRLGRRVAPRLRDAGCDVRVLTRRSREATDGVRFLTGDLRSGEGVDAAVDGVAVIVHCATSSKGDVEATGHLVQAAARAGSPHLVYVSIVGVDHLARWGYPKAKLQAERVVVDSACLGRCCGSPSSTTTSSPGWRGCPGCRWCRRRPASWSNRSTPTRWRPGWSS